MQFNDKVVVITGAGSGIGRALAIGIAAVGAKAVVCTDLDGENAATTAAGIGAAASATALDVGDERAIEALVKQTEDSFGPQAVRTNIGGPRAPGAQARGQASFDGVLEPETVADACIEAIREERFLVLPHPEVATYFQRKANDYDRWLRGMRRFRVRIAEGR